MIDRKGVVLTEGIYDDFEAFGDRYLIGFRKDSDRILFDLISEDGEVVRTFQRKSDLEAMRKQADIEFGQSGTPLDKEMAEKYFYTKDLGNGYHCGALFSPEWEDSWREYLKVQTENGGIFEYGIRKALIKDGKQVGGFDYLSVIPGKDDLFMSGMGY